MGNCKSYYYPKDSFTLDDINKVNECWTYCVRTLSKSDIKKNGTMYQRMERKFNENFDVPTHLFSQIAYVI